MFKLRAPSHSQWNELETRSIIEKNAELVNRYDDTGATPLHCFPGLKNANYKDGKSFREIATGTGNHDIIHLFS